MAITYSISGGADAALFKINATTGALEFKVAPDFEDPKDSDKNNVYQVIVAATDADGTTTQAMNVTVTDVGEGQPPRITSAPAASIAENTTSVGTVTATDPDAGGTTPPPSGNSEDGSANAPAGTPQYSSVLDGYTKKPTWKVAGVDYHVGIDRTKYPTNAALANATTANLPSGATRSGNGISVSGSNVVIEGLDFTVGTVRKVSLNGTNGTVKNCVFALNSAVGSHLAAVNGSGNTVTQCEFTGSTTIGSVGGCLVGSNGQGKCTFTYNLFKDAYAIGGVFSSNNATTQDIVWKFNAMENAGCGRSSSGGQVHGDWIQQYNDTTHVCTGTYQYNLFLQSMSQNTATTQGLSLSSANTRQAPSVEYHADNNVMIAKTGAYVNFGVIMFPPNVNGPGTINDNFFDVTGMDSMGNVNPEYNPTGSEGHGPHNGPVTYARNYNMKNGTIIEPWH